MFRNNRVLRIRLNRILINQIKDTGSAGKRILQFGNHTGNFVEWFGILIGITEE